MVVQLLRAYSNFMLCLIFTINNEILRYGDEDDDDDVKNKTKE